MYTVGGMKCFSDVSGKQWSQCDQDQGFKTCFTKYNPSKRTTDVTGTGCTIIVDLSYRVSQKDGRFSEIKNILDLLCDDKEGEI